MLCRELDTDNSKNINGSVQQLTDCILQAAKQAIPRGRRMDYKPYWSNHLQCLHDQLAKARKRLEQLPSPEHTIFYNKARAAFDEEKNKEARKSWQEKTGSLNMEKDTQKLWNLTKALNDDQQHAPRAALLKEGTQIFTGKKAAYLLADSVREESLLDISREKQADIRMKTKEQLQKQSPTPSMTSEFSIHELNCAIRQLKNKKAPGKDGISNEMTRHLGSLAEQKLLDIYNHSWNTGTFPTSWKEAIIIPILKKGKDRHSKTSYRPINLLSCLGKTMERMVNRRLQHHLEKNGLLSPSQSGFRKNKSTEDQVTLLTQDIENGFQQRMKTLAVFVDLTKAFDKVWEEGLLFKLLRKRVCGNMYSWIQRYLFQRSARVRLDGQTSSSLKIREGVPQGGVSSPTLFIIFIDDICDQLSSHIPRALHADDLALWTKAEQVTTAAIRMQEAMNHISDWAKEWLVMINRTKTTCFSLSPKREEFILQISGQEVERTAGLLSLGERREEKLLRQSEKTKRLPSHPLHSKFEAPTKNRLKRQSPNHLVKALQQKHRIPSSARSQPLDMLQNNDDWQTETSTIILDIPGIQTKDHHTDEELRSLTPEALSVAYPSTTWARAYTDGSAEEAAKNSGGGVFIKLPDGSSQQTTELKPTPCLQQPRL